MDDDRDYVGYGASPPDPQWPDGARLALNINVNFEGGGERSVMDGDDCSEGMLNDIGQPSTCRAAQCRWSNRYSNTAPASAAGDCWTCSRASASKVCLLAVARPRNAIPPSPAPGCADGHELVSHHYRWLDYQTMPEAEEREHVRRAHRTLERVAGVALSAG